MYENFYNLKAEPFRLTPDHKYSYNHSSYAKAKAYMQYAFERAEGFVMITGKAGAGKTTLVNDLVDSLPTSKVKIATLVSTQLEADDLLRMTAFAFGLDADITHKSTILQGLSKLLISNHRKGQRALLIVDEAQDLSVSSMEELRLLTNFQVHNHQLVQIFLLGQEALGELIQKPEMEQVHQRLIAGHHLDALSKEDTKAYIRHRLTKAGWRGDPAISNAVYSIVFEASGGIPRRINSICSRLLLHGSVEQRHQLGIFDAKTVLEELEQEGLAGERRSTGINFNEADTYDVEDSLIEGLDNKEKKNLYSLEPYINEDAKEDAKTANDASENTEGSTPSSVKDTWIDKVPDPKIVPEPKTQQPTLNDGLINTPGTHLKQDPVTSSNNPAASEQKEPDSYPADHVDKPVTKKLTHRHFHKYTFMGILSLIIGLILLLAFIWQPDLGRYFSFINHQSTVETYPNTSFNQHSGIAEAKARTITKNPKTSSTTGANAYPSSTKSEIIDSIQIEHIASEPVLGRPAENNATSQKDSDTINAGEPTPDAIISFEFNKFYIRPEFQRELDAISNDMNAPPQKKALIVGYSDRTGDAAYNLNLSKQRAIAVAAYLTRQGVENNRITTDGKGYSDDASPEAPPKSGPETKEQRIVKIFLSSQPD